MRRAELQEALGAEGLNVLISHFGGKRVYIPSAVKDGHPLMILPPDLLASLIKECRGISINVPAENRDFRNNSIIESFYQGKTYREISSTYEITERWVSEIISRAIKNKQATVV